MNDQINNRQIYEYIKGRYLLVSRRALAAGLPIDNIGIYLRGDIKTALGLGGTLTITHHALVCDVPVIVDDSIEEVEKGDEYQSDFYIYDPDWPEAE